MAEKKKAINPFTVIFILLGFAILLTPSFIGWSLSNNFIESQRASCGMVESGLRQFNPSANQEFEPMTEEHCLRSVQAQIPVARIIWVLGGNIFAVVFGGIALTLWFVIGRHIFAAFKSKS